MRWKKNKLRPVSKQLPKLIEYNNLETMIECHSSRTSQETTGKTILTKMRLPNSRIRIEPSNSSSRIDSQQVRLQLPDQVPAVSVHLLHRLRSLSLRPKQQVVVWRGPDLRLHKQLLHSPK